MYLKKSLFEYKKDEYINKKLLGNKHYNWYDLARARVCEEFDRFLTSAKILSNEDNDFILI